MAVNLNPNGQDGDDDVLPNINTTPLVDVMLVLLIIFLITIPVVNSSIQVNLPKEKVERLDSKPNSIIISVNENNRIFWGESPVENLHSLTEQLIEISKQKPQPDLQIRGDANARYKSIGEILLACQTAGIAKVSFVSDPTVL